MKKSWKLLPKVLSGQKKVESRWYKTRCEAWDKVKAGDIVWFKDSGEPITVKTSVSRVLQFDNLTPVKVRQIIHRYGGECGIGPDDLEYLFQWARDKKYCALIFLKNPQKIARPFHINKTGFGSARAWITIKDIDAIKTL